MIKIPQTRIKSQIKKYLHSGTGLAYNARPEAGRHCPARILPFQKTAVF